VKDSFSAQESEWARTRQLTREEVCMVYDVKPTVIGDLTHGTYSNVQELNRDFYKSTLRPWLTLIEETIQAQLIDPEPAWEGLFVEFDMKEMLRGTPLEEAQALKLQFESAGITPNERRDITNQPRINDPMADELFVQGNNLVPLSKAGQVPAETAPTPYPDSD
jgi:HK97 family phage portal protein